MMPASRSAFPYLAFGFLFVSTPLLPAQNDGREAFRGKVMLEKEGRLVPFPGGRVGATNEAGRMTESAAVGRDGSYELRLAPGERCTIQVLVPGYSFEPGRVMFFPQNGREIPPFVARPLPTGTVIGTMKPDPRTPQSVSVANQRFLVRQASNGQLLSTLTPDGRKKFRYSDYEGREILIEPQPSPGVTWTPASQRVTLARGEAKTVEFFYLPASAVSTGNLNLAKDGVEIPDIVKPRLSLRIVDANEILIGGEVELSVPSIEGASRTPDTRYTFLYRYDNERNWRTAGNNQRNPSARFRVAQAGGFECRAIVLMNGAPVGKADKRAFAAEKETPPGTVKLVGKPRVPDINDLSTIPPLPDPEFVFVKVLLDRPQGEVGAPRRVSAHLQLKPDRATARPTTRDGRMISFYTRHESQSGWTRVTPDVPSLTWNWTPSRPGRWHLRVDVWSTPEEGRSRGHHVISRDEREFAAGAEPGNIISQSQSASVSPAPSPAAKRPVRPLAKLPASRPSPSVAPVSQLSPRPSAGHSSQPSPTPVRRPLGLLPRPGDR